MRQSTALLLVMVEMFSQRSQGVPGAGWRYWKAKLSDKEISSFKDELGDLDVKYQFITLAGFHSLNYSMFELSENYRDKGMTGFVDLQEKEFAAQVRGFTAVKHQREVGAGYFDAVGQICTGSSDLSAIKGSTEEGQF